MPPAQNAIDYQAFLREHLDQPHSIMRYELAHETLWVKRANKGNPALNYWLLNTLASLFGTPVLRPVPNPGGAQSVATEVRRLRSLQAIGLSERSALRTCGLGGRVFKALCQRGGITWPAKEPRQ